jgi:hypothetical protein
MSIYNSTIIAFLLCFSQTLTTGCDKASKKLTVANEADSGVPALEISESSDQIIDAGPSLYTDVPVCPATEETILLLIETSGGPNGEAFGNFKVENGELHFFNVNSDSSKYCIQTLSKIQMDEMISELGHVRWTDVKEEYATDTPGSCPNGEISIDFNATIGECKVKTHICRSQIEKDDALGDFANWCASTFAAMYNDCTL